MPSETAGRILCKEEEEKMRRQNTLKRQQEILKDQPLEQERTQKPTEWDRKEKKGMRKRIDNHGEIVYRKENLENSCGAEDLNEEYIYWKDDLEDPGGDLCGEGTQTKDKESGGDWLQKFSPENESIPAGKVRIGSEFQADAEALSEVSSPNTMIPCSLRCIIFYTIVTYGYSFYHILYDQFVTYRTYSNSEVTIVISIIHTIGKSNRPRAILFWTR